MIFKDYYKMLELETSKVSIEEIKSSYRTVAKKYHPDVNIGDTLAEEKIKDINEAYRVLSDPRTRRKYDRIWNANVNKKRKAFSRSGKNADSVFSEFFYMLFGDVEQKAITTNKKTTPIKGKNIETSIKINIEEAFYGAKKKIILKNKNGKQKNIEIIVPEGIANEQKIRLIGQGEEGHNGGKNGDLFIKINIKNKPNFKIKGKDLYTDLLLTPWEASLGLKTTINSIDEKVAIYIPQGIQTGEEIKISGKGYKDEQGNRGDLIAEVKIMVPKELSKEEKEIFEKLKNISTFNPRNSYKTGKNQAKIVDKVQAI